MALFESKKQAVLRKFHDQCDLLERMTKSRIDKLADQVKRLDIQRKKLENHIQIVMKKSKTQLNILQKEKQQAEVDLQAEINE